jgi:hypothetical protein
MAEGWGRRVREQCTRFATGRTTSYTAPTHVALLTGNCGDDGQGNAAGAQEPTSTGGYARTAITFVDPVVYTSVTNDTVNVCKHNSLAFGASSAAYSTGATVLNHIALYASSSTFTEVNFCGRASIATPPAVASAGINVSIAADAIAMGMISS